MRERLLSILNLKQSESRYVFDLLSIQLFIGIANSFLNIVSFTFFIYRFSIHGLPYAYLAIAAGLLLLNVAYEKLEHKFTPLRLIKILIAASLVLFAFFWLGILSWDHDSFVFLLFVWSTLFYMLTGYAYWGLVSLLFNVRESRRVFSIVGAGDIPAKLIGYLFAPLLIPLIGVNNLLVLAMVSLAVGFLLVRKLAAKKRWEKINQRSHGAHTDKHHTTGSPTKMSSTFSFFFRHKLIFTISLLSLLSYNVFNLIDYTFISQVKAKYHDLAQLASFLAVFFAAGRLIALVLKLVFTSRVIERLGIIYSLLITPVALFIFSLLFFAVSGNVSYSLYVFGVMALITEVLRSTMQEPVFFILFQPLSEHIRLKGHIIAKGYMLAPSYLIVGLSLIGLRYAGVVVNIPLSMNILVVNLFIWAAIVFYIRREYTKVLHSSISKGVFNGDHVQIYDKKTIETLVEKVKSGQETEKIYALRLLEAASFSGLSDLLKTQLKEENVEVKKYALVRLQEKGDLDPFLLKTMAESEHDPFILQMITGLLCRIDPEYLHTMADHISELDYIVRKNVIIHLLNQSEFTYLYKAGNEINSLLVSPLPAERELALEIISDLKSIKFTDAIKLLIKDGDLSVKRNALIAACKLKVKELLPFILERLSHHHDKYLAMQGLFQYGDALFEDIKELPVENSLPYTPELLRVASKCRGPHSTAFLLAATQGQPMLIERAVHALWQKGYEAELVPEIHHFQTLLGHCLKLGIEKTHYHAHVPPQFRDRELVQHALTSEIRNDLVTALKICALLYHKKELNRVVELVENNDSNKLYNGMEMLELLLPKRTSRQVIELLDYLLDPGFHKRAATAMDHHSFFEQIIITQASKFNAWTRSVCLYSSFRNKEMDVISRVGDLREEYAHDNVIWKETRDHVLNSLQQSTYVID
jgi:AAA family ATP:ADP antiporter